MEPTPIHREIKVTPYNGQPKSLYRFLMELTLKVTLKRWANEKNKLIVTESLLAKGEQADRLMESYQTLSQTTITTFDDQKQCLIELYEDTEAQDRANRQLLDFHFDKVQHRSFAEYFVEFSVIIGKSSHLDATKYN